MCNETKWFGIQFPDGHWLKSPEGLRVAFENEQDAAKALSSWTESYFVQGGVVKEFLPPPPGCALYV